MDRQILTHVDLEGTVHLVGRLWARSRKGRESATFQYSASWLEHSERFALEPALDLGVGPFHTSAGKTLFGALGDSAPDRWGRVLMRRAERKRADSEGEAHRTLREIDYLLMVNDEARQGALRFAEQEGGPFLAVDDRTRIPPLIELARLLAATERLVDEAESDEDLRLLLAPGSSLGGARPKASIRDGDGDLAIAKFPHKSDEYAAVLWEAVALELADRAGIRVPSWRIENVSGQPVLLLRRFDRIGRVRIPFVSAMSMLGAKDREMRSYMEIADVLSRYGSSAKADKQELWRRLVFNILISNTDDHLRNHAFLWEDHTGWRLSPAYDLNPVPIDIKPRVLSTAIDLDDPTASLETAYMVADHFELDHAGAKRVAAEVGASVRAWRRVGADLGIAGWELKRMASAFEHCDLETATRATV